MLGIDGIVSGRQRLGVAGREPTRFPDVLELAMKLAQGRIEIGRLGTAGAPGAGVRVCFGELRKESCYVAALGKAFDNLLFKPLARLPGIRNDWHGNSQSHDNAARDYPPCKPDTQNWVSPFLLATYGLFSFEMLVVLFALFLRRPGLHWPISRKAAKRTDLLPFGPFWQDAFAKRQQASPKWDRFRASLVTWLAALKSLQKYSK